jgi:hypothetical protein
MPQEKTQALYVFNPSAHNYILSVRPTGVNLFQESVCSEHNYLNRPVDYEFNGEKLTGLAVLGNHHAEAVYRDLVKRELQRVDDLKDFSMMTIGDFFLITPTMVYMFVNGDLNVHNRKGNVIDQLLFNLRVDPVLSATMDPHWVNETDRSFSSQFLKDA